MTGESFAATATRLAGAAGWVLYWTPDSFWRSTPAELAAVLGAAASGEGGGVTRDHIDSLKERFPDG